MNTMEVLTLLLVIFAALSYIDNHFDKKKEHPVPSQKSGCYLFISFRTDGKSDSHPIHFLSRL